MKRTHLQPLTILSTSLRNLLQITNEQYLSQRHNVKEKLLKIKLRSFLYLNFQGPLRTSQSFNFLGKLIYRQT
jgi:hypothetical protein